VSTGLVTVLVGEEGVGATSGAGVLDDVSSGLGWVSAALEAATDAVPSPKPCREVVIVTVEEVAAGKPDTVTRPLLAIVTTAPAVAVPDQV
jgi:hypothetical protein